MILNWPEVDLVAVTTVADDGGRVDEDPGVEVELAPGDAKVAKKLLGR